jgi:RNA polymerase sigma-70 factor (ECF subfamily)
MMPAGELMDALRRDHTVADDTAVLASLQRNETGALDAAMNRYERLAYWAAYAVVGVHRDTEEVAADTLVLLWRTRSCSFGGSGARWSFGAQRWPPWIVASARYLAQNRLRTSRRHPVAPIDAEREGHETTSVELLAERAELIAAIRTAVAELSDVDRAIFTLCIEEGLSYDDAATSLGLAHGAVRNRLSRLRKQLRSSLASR